MIGINWKIFLIAALLAIGLYLIVIYRNNDQLVYSDQQRYRKYRQIGWLLIAVAFGSGIYLYYTRPKTVKAYMINECTTCRNYAHRHDSLRPYSSNEVPLLAKHAAACNTCSRMCFDEINFLTRFPKINKRDLQQKKKACGETTKYALLARKELNRLQGKLREKRVAMWQAGAGGDPFPEVPIT